MPKISATSSIANLRYFSALTTQLTTYELLALLVWNYFCKAVIVFFMGLLEILDLKAYRDYLNYWALLFTDFIIFSPYSLSLNKSWSYFVRFIGIYSIASSKIRSP